MSSGHIKSTNTDDLSLADAVANLLDAARDNRHVNGLTHNFYRYPARFSPIFARAAISLLSKDGDLVLDPFMGGGTTIVEAIALGRRAVGIDLNSLATFIARVKTTPLSRSESIGTARWIENVVPLLTYRGPNTAATDRDDARRRNLNLHVARPIAKALELARSHIHRLGSERARDFVKCVLLRTAQWALDGRRTVPPLSHFRAKILRFTDEMLCDLGELRGIVELSSNPRPDLTIACANAHNLPHLAPFSRGQRAALVLTSPPYPGVHVLYHRWQINGGRETPAPYWITDTVDGKGSSYYNFGSRRELACKTFFESYARSLDAIRSVMKPDGILVQLIACKTPREHLDTVGKTLLGCGFEPSLPYRALESLSRVVPNRRWYATQRPSSNAATEFLLLHRLA